MKDPHTRSAPSQDGTKIFVTLAKSTNLASVLNETGLIAMGRGATSVSGTVLTWPTVVRAAIWLMERSPNARAELREALERFESRERVSRGGSP